MAINRLFLCCAVLLLYGLLSEALLNCEHNGFSNYDCAKGCCVDSDQPWNPPYCCDKPNTKLLLGQIITLALCIGFGIVVGIVFTACWIHERNRYKTRVQAGFVLLPPTGQGNAAHLYPTPVNGLQAGTFTSNPTYPEPYPLTNSHPHRLPPINQHAQS